MAGQPLVNFASNDYLGLASDPAVLAAAREALREGGSGSPPVPRVGQPWKVAELVTFLASDRAAYITGAAVDINGGDLIG